MKRYVNFTMDILAEFSKAFAMLFFFQMMGAFFTASFEFRVNNFDPSENLIRAILITSLVLSLANILIRVIFSTVDNWLDRIALKRREKAMR
jgi:hypothetical protein